ncbi:MAG: hypothetical protein KBT11_09115 [Treponema sp.]|nr:hypothetical protein [Candidatus Treponema equifaecale]
MKRLNLVFLALLFFAIFSSYSEDMQIVFPKTIFVGDTVEVKYIFKREQSPFSDELFTNSRLELAKNYSVFENQSSSFAVTEARLEKIGSEYTLTLKLLPWKSGYLTIPTFDLTSLVRHSLNKIGYGSSFPISLKPIQVNSLVEKSGNRNFRPQSAPLVMPGTTLMLVLTGIFYLILFSAVIFILVRLPVISAFLERLAYLLSLKKNSRKSVKKLEKLLKESDEIIADSEYAMEIQKILREFLNKRFSADFASTSTSGFYEKFCELMGGELSGNQENSVEKLVEIFYRTDFIRYSKDGTFTADERATITQDCMDLIFNFDNNQEEK